MDTCDLAGGVIILSVDDSTLTKVIAFIQKSTVADLNNDELLVSNLEGWDLGFFEMPVNEIVLLLKAAEYMLINSLIHVCCLLMARIIHENDAKAMTRLCEYQK